MKSTNKTSSISGKLIIRHAGSLNASLGAVNKEFVRLYTGVQLEDIPGPSGEILRLVMAGQPCDILASADYVLFDKWMLPDFADWYLIFAHNEFMLRCTDKCLYHDEINAQNWPEILQREGVTFWRPDPDNDPGGYRAVMVLQLAAKYYHAPHFFNKIMSPAKSTVTNGGNSPIIESSYTFAYRTSPCPAGQWNIKLPDEINLGSQAYAAAYRQAVVTTNGKYQGEKLTLYGEPMLFAVTIPRNSENKKAAVEWLRFLLGVTGAGIMEKVGFKLADPVTASDPEKIPDELKEFLK